MGTDGACKWVVIPSTGGPTLLKDHPEVLLGRNVGVEISGLLHLSCIVPPSAVLGRSSSTGSARRLCFMSLTTHISALLGEGAKPLIVFDGDRAFEAKAATQHKRRDTRAKGARDPPISALCQ